VNFVEEFISSESLPGSDPFQPIVDYLYSLMWRTTPITVFALVALMPWLDPPGIISFDWRFANTSAILISAIFGFLLQWSGALALGYVLLQIFALSHLFVLQSSVWKN
jgi:hypothetical protein